MTAATRIALFVLPLIGMHVGTPVEAANTLQLVRSHGFVLCGVSNGVPGFSAPDAHGKWSGLDVDLCRALAAAIFGDESKAKFRPLEPGEGLTALRQGEIDILTRATEWTLSLEAEGGLRFVGPSFFDGQAILVRKDLGVSSLLQLSGARICMQERAELRQGLEAYFGARGMPIETVAFERQAEAVKAYAQLRCEALTDELSAMPGVRQALPSPEEHAVLVQLISNEPMGPVVRQGDETWQTIARWTLHALLAAEEVGLTQKVARQVKAPTQATAKRFLAVEADLGLHLGLAPDWAEAIVGQVGNYAEVFDRNLGAHGPLGLERGNNNLWSHGGMMIVPAMR